MEPQEAQLLASIDDAQTRRWLEAALKLAPGGKVEAAALKALSYAQIKVFSVEEYRAVIFALVTLIDQFRPERFPDEHRWRHALGLLFQLHGLALSGSELFEGSIVGDAKVFDPTGLSVVARTAMETAVAFDYVFVAPMGDEEEASVRYMLWRLAGVKFYLDPDYPQFSDATRQDRAEAESLFANFEPRVRQILESRGKTTKSINDVIRGGRWLQGGRIETYSRSGIGPIFSRHMFRAYSSHAHADGLSAIHSFHFREHPDAWVNFALGALRSIAIAIARTVHGLLEIDPEMASGAGIPVEVALIVSYHADFAGHEFSQETEANADHNA